MTMFRNFERRSAALLILITLLICLSGGCARRTVYVSGDHKLTRVEAGQPAPRSGVIVSEAYLAELYEQLGRSDGKSAK